MLVCPAAAMETAQVIVLSRICSTTAESAGSSAPQAQGHSLLAGVGGDRGLAPPLKAQHKGFTQLTSTGHPGSLAARCTKKCEAILYNSIMVDTSLCVCLHL